MEEKVQDTGGYQPSEPETPPTPLADMPQAPEAEKTDEELAAAAGEEQLEADAGDPLGEAAERAASSDVVPVTVLGYPGPAAVGAIIGAFRSRPLLEPEDQVGRVVAGQASTIHLEDAMAHWRLEPEHVLGWRGAPEDGLIVVTAGGRKLRWPDDYERQLTDSERGGVAAPKNRVFPSGYLRRDPSKDPQD